LEFNKVYGADDYTLNEWLANQMAQRNSAFENNEKEVKKYSKSIESLKRTIEEIIEIPIDFKFKNEKLKVVTVKAGVELDVLSDGLRSVISWISDLLMRMDALKWKNDLPIFKRELFLDEMEVHLHPSWLRKILPVVQKLFKNAQTFIATHSLFIVNSVDGAYVHELKLNSEGNCYAEQPLRISSTVMPIDEILEEKQSKKSETSNFNK
jgi:predicted ATP-binding protein involved in virulence